MLEALLQATYHVQRAEYQSVVQVLIPNGMGQMRFIASQSIDLIALSLN